MFDFVFVCVFFLSGDHVCTWPKSFLCLVNSARGRVQSQGACLDLLAVVSANAFRFVGPSTGTGHVPQLVFGVGVGVGLLSLVRLDLVPLLQPGPRGMVPMLGISQVFCVYYLKLRELV